MSDCHDEHCREGVAAIDFLAPLGGVRPKGQFRKGSRGECKRM